MYSNMLNWGQRQADVVMSQAMYTLITLNRPGAVLKIPNV
mgnify:CR=1 FL=1